MPAVTRSQTRKMMDSLNTASICNSKPDRAVPYQKAMARFKNLVRPEAKSPEPHVLADAFIDALTTIENDRDETKKQLDEAKRCLGEVEGSLKIQCGLHIIGDLVYKATTQIRGEIKKTGGTRISSIS